MTPTAFTVDELIAVRDKSVNAAFMDFNHAVVCNPEALFVFYEGQDNDYYYPRLLRYVNRSIEPIRCNGKEKVMAVYKMLVTKPEYDKYCKGFFVDKDFDLNEELVLENFYVTSGYSIENYYLTDSCMESFLKQMLNFHTGDPMLASIMDDYRLMRQKYFNAILLFNTWYCAVKRKYGKVNKDICLDKKMPKGFVLFDYDTKDVLQHYTMANIDEKYDTIKYPVTVEELSKAEEYLRIDLLKNHRGKYGLSFMYEYIDNLLLQLKNTPSLTAYYRKITISYDNILSILSPFADTEQALIDYLTRIAA